MSGFENEPHRTLVGDGTTEIVTGVEDGAVVVHFKKTINWVKLAPEIAVQIGKALIDNVSRMGYDVKIRMPKKELSSEKYTLVCGRVRFMLLKKRTDQEPDEVLARRIVDLVLSETQ